MARYAAAGRLLDGVAKRAAATLPYGLEIAESRGIFSDTSDAALVAPALILLRAAASNAAGVRGGARTLADFGLSDADLQAVADVAELDDNSLAWPAPLGRTHFSRILIDDADGV